MSKALEGVRVLELGHVISAPFCAMLLGDLGAEIIKIERPGVGEFYRDQAIKNEKGISIVYPAYNRNKKCITLDLKNEKAKEVVFSLIRESDVFIENYRPGLLKKMGLGYDELKKVNPKLVMVSISGFGQTGPNSHKPAYDMTISAVSGFMSLSGPQGTPTKCGPAVSDFLSGLYGAIGILGALRHSEKTGRGQYIDISMMDCAMSVLDAFFAQSHFTGSEPKAMGNRRNNYAPVNSFPALDGHVYISASLQKHWENLCKVMNRKDLLDDEAYATSIKRKNNEEELEKIVTEWTLTFTTAELVKKLDEHDIPCAPVQSINQVMNDPHVKDRKSIIEISYPGLGPYPMPSFVPRFSTLEVPLRRAPTLGENNEEIYCGLLGYSKEEYESFSEI